MAIVFESAISCRLSAWFCAGVWLGGTMSVALAMVTDESRCATSHCMTVVSWVVTDTVTYSIEPVCG